MRRWMPHLRIHRVLPAILGGLDLPANPFLGDPHALEKVLGDVSSGIGGPNYISLPACTCTENGQTSSNWHRTK